jgi:hypothetical protein
MKGSLSDEELKEICFLIMEYSPMLKRLVEAA